MAIAHMFDSAIARCGIVEEGVFQEGMDQLSSVVLPCGLEASMESGLG